MAGNSRHSAGHRIVVLDSLRGVVALVVVAHHVWAVFYSEIHAILHGLSLTFVDMVQAQNHRAVMAFFVLSGFTIALTSQARMPLPGPLLREYAGRRVRRIVPLFYLSLIWTALLVALYTPPPTAFSLTTLLGNMMFLQTSASASGNWFVPFGGNGPYWSLSYEMFYYLALPVMLIASGARRGWGDFQRLRMLLVGIAAMMLGLLLLKIAPNPFAHFSTLWIVWIAGFIAFDLPSNRQSLALLTLAPAACWGIVLLLGLLGQSSSTLRSAAEGTTLAWLFGCVCTWRSWMAHPLARAAEKVFNACFSKVGRGSYALYLLHYPLLLALHEVLTAQPTLPFAWVLASVGFVFFAVWFCPWIERVSSLVMPLPRVRQHKVS